MKLKKVNQVWNLMKNSISDGNERNLLSYKQILQFPVWQMKGCDTWISTEILQHFLPDLKLGRLLVSSVCLFETVEKKCSDISKINPWYQKLCTWVWIFAIWRRMVVSREMVPKRQARGCSLAAAWVQWHSGNELMAQVQQPHYKVFPIFFFCEREAFTN